MMVLRRWFATAAGPRIPLDGDTVLGLALSRAIKRKLLSGNSSDKTIKMAVLIKSVFGLMCAITLIGSSAADKCVPKLMLHNVDGSDFFDRNWTSYKTGFGNPRGNYWAGLDEISRRSNTWNYTLKIELQALTNHRWYYAQYGTFKVANEADNYRLTLGGYSGTARTDSFAFHNRMKFTTIDRDNDQVGGNCAGFGGGFWYKDCFRFSPTAKRDGEWGFTWRYLIRGSGFEGFTQLETVRMRLSCP